MKQDRFYKYSLLISFFMVFLFGLLAGMLVVISGDKTQKKAELHELQAGTSRQVAEWQTDEQLTGEQQTGEWKSRNQQADEQLTEERFLVNDDHGLQTTDEEIEKFPADLDYKYFLIVVDHSLEVFQKGQKEVYLKTDVERLEMPEELRRALEQGVAIRNDSELFDFLENYTS